MNGSPAKKPSGAAYHESYEAEGFKLLGAVHYFLSIADDIIDPKLQLTAAFPLILMMMQG